MLVVMTHGAFGQGIAPVAVVIRKAAYEAQPVTGRQRTALGLIGNDGRLDSGRLEALPGVLLGIRSFDDQTRNLLDLTAIPVVKSLSHLPVADPSHGTGIRNKVNPWPAPLSPPARTD
jgi:hypothetical protein